MKRPAIISEQLAEAAPTVYQRAMLFLDAAEEHIAIARRDMRVARQRLRDAERRLK